MSTTELREIYSSNPVAQRYYETVQLTHSSFTKPYYLVQDDEDHDWRLEDGTTVTFISFPIAIILPEVGSTRQDVTFVFDNIGQLAIRELELAAENIQEPIKLVYRVYVDNYDDCQITPLHLVLTNIVADNYKISAVATRSDLYKRLIPTGNKALYDYRFWGLYL